MGCDLYKIQAIATPVTINVPSGGDYYFCPTSNIDVPIITQLKGVRMD